MEITIFEKYKNSCKRFIQHRREEFQKSIPGQRFRNRYLRRRQKRTHNSPVKRFFFILIGLLIVLLGMLLWFIPGPGWLTIFIGAVIIARESLLVARFLDWLELKLMKTADKYFM